MLPELVSVIRTNTNSDGIRGKIFGTNWYYDNQGFSRATSVSSRRSIAGAAEDFDQGKIREKTRMDNHYYFFTEKYLLPRILELLPFPQILIRGWFPNFANAQWPFQDHCWSFFCQLNDYFSQK